MKAPEHKGGPGQGRPVRKQRRTRHRGAGLSGPSGTLPQNRRESWSQYPPHARDGLPAVIGPAKIGPRKETRPVALWSALTQRTRWFDNCATRDCVLASALARFLAANKAAGVAELADAPDSKSGGALNPVRVRLPPPALFGFHRSDSVAFSASACLRAPPPTSRSFIQLDAFLHSATSK
jgi:hypothetical protein